MSPPAELQASEFVTAACDQSGEWLGVAVVVHQAGEWTVFQDLTGYLAGFRAADWLALAGSEELIFASYNDSVPCGHFVSIANGRVEREFLDDTQNPGLTVDAGRLRAETGAPFRTWIDVASFVDDDELGCWPDLGDLWVFSHQTTQA